MSFDRDAFMKANKSAGDGGSIGRIAQVYGGGGRNPRFSIITLAQLEPGSYKMRFLPGMPGKVPLGYIRMITHKFEVTEGKPPTVVVCTKAEDDAASCFMCDALESLMEDFKDQTQIVQEALSGLSPWERIYFPIVIEAGPDPTSKEKYPKWEAKDGQETGAIITISAAGVREQIASLYADYPNMNDERRGRYLRLIKESQSRYSFRPLDPGPLARPELLDDYPDIRKIFSKSTKIMTYSEMQSLWQSAWWTKNLLDLSEEPVGV